MGLVKGIHHVSMKCCTEDEYQRAVAFYKDILGISMKSQTNEVTLLDTGDGIIEIFNNGTEKLQKGVIRHFAFAVDDIEACTKAVAEAGYEVFISPKDIGFAIIAFCYGPLGEEIEFFVEKKENT